MATKPRPATRPADFVSNGWNIWFHRLFRERFATLVAEVEALAQKNPKSYQHERSAKLLAALVDIIEKRVPSNPDAAEFRLGRTLGPFTNWRRVKHNGLPDRYRLFFQFRSSVKVIVFVWLNDEDTLRKREAKTDVYAVFRKMLESGKVPNDFNQLLTKAAATPGP